MDTEIKLNLGCGTQCIDNWINVDNSLNAKLSRYPLIRFVLWKLGVINNESYERVFESNRIVFFNITKKFPYLDNSVDYIYSSHTFEHITVDKIEYTITECYRVLKPKGICRVVVPDLFKPTQKYIKEYLSFLPKVKNGNYYLHTSIDINNLYHTDGKLFDHKYMFDFISLAKIFKKAGFEIINESKPLCSSIPEIHKIEKRTDPEINLYIECVKK